MPKRKGLTKTVRFEVFKRDGFACQYCGATSPDVLLVVDHIKPVAEGGTNDILNLVTACDPCNSGKGARELDDTSSIEKQRRQLEQLQDRREQMEMMLQWKESLLDLDGHAAQRVAEIFSRMVPGWFINAGPSLQLLSRLIRKHGLQAVIDAVAASADSYVALGADGKATKESAAKAWDKVPAILKIEERAKREPWVRDLYRIKPRVMREFGYAKEWRVVSLLETAFRRGVSAETLHSIVTDSRNWFQWQASMEALLET